MKVANTKRGKGRPVGTKSYCAIKTQDITTLFQGAEIPVSKNWLKKIGVDPSQFRDFDINTNESIHHIEVSAHVVTKGKTVGPKSNKKGGKVKTTKVNIHEGEEIEFVIEA
jgi:hypothetical protein